MSNAHTISQWEKAIEGRNDIHFTAMYLSGGRVSEVKGYVFINGTKINVCWLENGRCYGGFRNITAYNLNFPIDD